MATRYSRFPQKFVTYQFGGPDGHQIIFDPADEENVRVRGNFVEVLSHTRMKHEKIGMDSSAGWMG